MMIPRNSYRESLLRLRKGFLSRLWLNSANRAYSTSPPRRSFTGYAVGISGSLLAAYGAYHYGRNSIIVNPPSDLFPLESTTKLSDIQPPKYCTDDELRTAINEITKAVGAANVKNSEVEIEAHSKNDFTTHMPRDTDRPRYVVYVESTQQVSDVLKIINKYNVPVVPWAGGTSLEGHFFSTRQGIVLDTSRMNKVLQVNRDDLDAVVQCGVNWMDLNKHLEPYDLMLGVDCGPNGLIGGMISTNASGILATRYGAMVHNVVSVTVVLIDGTVIKTKQRPRKSSAGYNLTGLFVGSEGTLGVVTEAVVKLNVRPGYETVVVGQFPTILDTTNTVAQLFSKGIQPEAIELLDRNMMHFINYSGYFSKEWLEVPTIFFKVGGLNKTVVDEIVKEMRSVCNANNCRDFIFAKDKEEEEELFLARKNAFYAIMNYGYNEISEDVKLWVSDIAVPLLRLSPVLEEVVGLMEASGLKHLVVGHVGDGNFHADMFYRPHEKDQCAEVIDKMMEIGLANEGTSSGEHAIGGFKRRYLEMELGEAPVSLMRRIKFALDPKRLLNPDKVFKTDPADDGAF